MSRSLRNASASKAKKRALSPSLRRGEGGSTASWWSTIVASFHNDPAPLLIRIAGICALSGLAIIFYQYYATWAEGFLRFGYKQAGTANAPYSDALGLWLRGGLHMLFGLPQFENLYRPTIALFWGSIIALTGRVSFVPLVFVGLLFASVLAFYVYWRQAVMGSMIILWVLLLALDFDKSIATLTPNSLGVDFPAFVITVVGTLLLFSGTVERRQPWLPILVGALALGVTAAIRGPMMVGGLVLIAGLLWASGKRSVGLIAATLLCFAAPVVGDVLLQRHFNVVNNGLVSLFCVYTDPSHEWTADCHSRFLELRPGLSEMANGYLTFLVSTSGIGFVYAGVEEALRRDLSAYVSWTWNAVLTIFFLISTGTRSALRKDVDLKLLMHQYPVQSSFLLIFWSAACIKPFIPAPGGFAVLLVLAACVAVTLRFKLWMPLTFVTAYTAGVVFLALLGLTWYDRLTSTFSFLFHLGVLLAFVPTQRESFKPSAPTLRGIGVSVLAVFVALYTCWAWWPSGIRSAYLAEVNGMTAAIKLAEEEILDRSLYFTGDGLLLYTSADGLDIGAVRQYRRLRSTEIRDGNESFVRPNVFLD